MTRGLPSGFSLGKHPWQKTLDRYNAIYAMS
jgi:hypothetical protein